jgi:hypothetical protein
MLRRKQCQLTHLFEDGTPGFLYLGLDQTGQMLEIITVAIPGDELVIHVMPYRYRRKKKS